MHALDAAPFLARLVIGLAAAFFTWLIALDMGSALVRRLAPELSRSVNLAIGAALGYAAVGLSVGLLGLFHGLKTPLIAGLPILIVVLRSRVWLRRAREVTEAARGAAYEARRRELLERLIHVAGAVAFITALAAAALPSAWWDPIAYHLPIAARALQSGTFSFDATMTQTGFPLLAEAAALPAYALAGSAGAAMVTLGAGLALAALCGVLAETLAPRSGTLAAMLVITSPLWIWLAPSFYVDIPFALFAAAAIALPLLTQGAGSQAGSAAITGSLAGAAAAVKYPGLLIAAMAVVLLLWVGKNQGPKRLALALAAFCVFALPWYARSYVLTTDPMYPFLIASFHHGSGLSAFASRYADMTRAWCGGPITLTDGLLVPWRMLTDPRRYCGDPGYALRLGIVFFAAAFASLRRLGPLIIVTIILTGLWFVESPQGRFFIPALCFYAVVVAAGVANLSGRLQRVATMILVLLSVGGVVMNWLPFTTGEASNSLVPAIKYTVGQESGSEYLRRRLETYAAALWLQKNYRGPGPVLALDDVRDYYFGPQAVWGNPYYQPVWVIDWKISTARRYARLTQSGFRYMVVNENPAYVRRTPTGIDWNALRDDERAGTIRRVFSENDVVVFELGKTRQ